MRGIALLTRIKDFPVGFFNPFAKRERIVYIEGCVTVGVVEKFEFLKLSIQEIKLVIIVEMGYVFHNKCLFMHRFFVMLLAF